MVDRLLSAHRGRSELCVMNDEAHHCYNGERARGSRIAGESAKEEAEAMMWFRRAPGTPSQGTGRAGLRPVGDAHVAAPANA